MKIFEFFSPYCFMWMFLLKAWFPKDFCTDLIASVCYLFNCSDQQKKEQEG